MESQTYTKYLPSRRTIVLDGQIEAKLRELQGQLIASEGKNYSLSKILNLLLLGGIFATSKLDSDEWRIIQEFAKGNKISLRGITLDSYGNHLSNVGMWV